MNAPLLAPHAQFAWRDDHTLAIEDPASPAARVRIENATPALVRWLRSCTGVRSRSAVLARASRLGIPRTTANALLDELEVLGLVALAAPDRPLPPPASSDTASALHQDLEALALNGLDAQAAYEQRQGHRVVVEGSDRVAHALVTLLAAGHIGAITPAARHQSRRVLTLRDISPFGPFAEDVGTIPAVALRRHVERLLGRDDGRARRRVAVLCQPLLDPADELPYRLAGIPYLRVATTSRYATIGPLTLPGHSACGSCLALWRGDEDPLWPHMLAQFDHQRSLSAPVDPVFAMAVAAEVAQRLLRVIDLGDPGALVNGTWHLDRTRPVVHRRRWQQHPDCACRAEAAVA